MHVVHDEPVDVRKSTTAVVRFSGLGFLGVQWFGLRRRNNAVDMGAHSTFGGSVTDKDAVKNMIKDLPGMAQLTDIVGSGLICKVLKEADFETVADVRQLFANGNEDDNMIVFLRRIQRAIDIQKAVHPNDLKDWARVGRKAYRVALLICRASVADDGDTVLAKQNENTTVW